jgi:hypothetical protein
MESLNNIDINNFKKYFYDQFNEFDSLKNVLCIIEDNTIRVKLYIDCNLFVLDTLKGYGNYYFLNKIKNLPYVEPGTYGFSSNIKNEKINLIINVVDNDTDNVCSINDNKIIFN